MRSVQYLASAIALASNVYAQVDSKVVCDSSTKLCLSSYTATEQKITFGIALPMNVSDPNGYDAIISITSPIANTWAGFCWGGTMVFNPLTVGWPNAKTATVSSRFAFGLTLPQPYDGADYTLLKGTVTNATHWTMVARCKGCTMWQANDGNNYVLNGTGVVPFAFAQGDVAVSEPANNQSAFNVHHSFGKWNHDLGAARIANFDAYVAANILPPAVVSTSTSNTATATTTSKSTLITSTVKPTSTATGKGKIPATCSGISAPKYTSVLAAGWKATKVAAGLTSPRSIVFDSLGNMLVVQSGKGISVHVMAGDGCVSSTKMLISLNSLNHGIQFSADGKTLYASTMTNVYSWPYTASTQTVGTRATIITGMYNGGHSTRTLLIAPHQPNLLLVSHGSNDNWDYASGNPKVGRSIIKVFDLNAIPSAGYNYVSQGWTAGYGMRNEVGIAFDGNNMLWGVENSGDDFKRKPNGGTQFDVHTDNPAEKLNYIGDITKENTKWFGYPTCFAVWKPSAFTDAKFQVGDQFVVSPNGTFKDDNCKGLATPPALTFQAHSAPIDAKFDADYSNLYVTFHGSWNRSPTTGFKLVVVPFKKGTDGAYTPVAPPTSDKGYTDIFANPNVEKCAGNGPSMSSGCSRPTGLAWDSQGRLYMTSDVTSDAEIFVLGKA